MAKKSPKNEPATVGNPDDYEQPTPPLGLLESAVRATHTGSACFASMADIAPLLTHPSGQLVEYNDAMTDGNGRIALRATVVGVQVFQANGNGAAPSVGPWAAQQTSGLDVLVPPAFMSTGEMLPSAFASETVVGSHTATTPRPTFKDGIPFPGKSKRTRSSHYNFDEMKVGQCFDTMPTGDNPEPWKRLASAASAASKRFEPKIFETLALDEGGVKFARTWRTQ